MSDKEYVAELERIIIFLCDVYSKGQDSLTFQEDSNKADRVNDKWLNIMMSFPTIQGSVNRIYVQKIGNLRTQHHNREAIKLSFQELFERIKQGRTEVK